MGAACIASALKADARTKNAVSVSLIDFSLEDDEIISAKKSGGDDAIAQFLANQLASKKPDFIAFSVYVWNRLILEKTCTTLKKMLPNSICIAGGPEVTADPLSFHSFDFMISGQGERAMVELVDSLAKGKKIDIQGVYTASAQSGAQTNEIARACPLPPDMTASPYLDGTIDVADICSEYDKDWFGRYEGKIYQNMVDTPVASSEGGKEVLAVDTVLIEDGKGQISVRIDYETSEKIRGWNFSLYLPEGIVYKRASISNQTYSNYEYYGYLGLRTSAKPDGGYLFAWYDSMQSGKMQLSSTKGILLTIDIEATEEFNGGMAEVRGIALSSYSCSSLELGNIADVKFEIKKATPETYIQAINNAIATNKHLNTELAAEAQVYVGKILDKGYDDTEEQTVMEQLKEYATRLAYTYLEIDVEEPGTLEELILAEVESLKDVQSLRVSGRVDSDELLQLQYEEYIRPEGMNLYELFADGTDMSEIGYISMTRLQRISLPETLTSMGRINSYSSLKQVTCYCMIPPYCYSNVVSRAGIELYVPKYSIDAYSQSAGWSNFNIHGMDTTPGDLKVYSSYTIDWLDSLTIDYKPNITLFSYDGRDYGKLTVDGSSTLSTDQLVMTCAPYQGRSAYAALLNNATMRADNISVELLLRANRWEFLTFPFDVKVSDIRLAQEGLPFAIRKYDGQKRADGLTAETWVDMTADSTLHAGQGYIWRFPAIYGSTNAFSIDAMQTVNKNNIFANSDIEVPLAYYESERGYNRSWNLIGNPYPCYYDTRAIQTTAPITVWDVNAQDYRAYSPLDDSYILTPGEAFFIQRPVDAESITLLKEGRQTDLSVRDVDYKPASARSYGNGGSRCVFNLTLSADGQSDHTRFVINPAASTDYEQAFDASKFQSLEKPAIQLYTIEGGLRYSINERPFANGTIALGMEIASSGIYTISLSTGAAQQVTLTDHLTGQEVRLDGNEDGYTFASEAGVFDSRFSISLGSGETTGISETDVTQPKSEYNVFDLQGRRVSNAKKGIYLIDGKKTVMK